MTFLELKDFFKNKFSIERHADIAKKLNVTAQAVNNWKVRNKVPHRIYLKVIEEYNFSKEEDLKNNVKIFHENKIAKNNLINDSIYFKERNISLWELIIVFKSNYKTILFTAIFINLLSIFYVQFIAQPVYISKASIIGANNESSTSRLSGMVAQLGIASPKMTQNKLVYPDIIRSRTLAKKVLRKSFYSTKHEKEKILLEILTNKKIKPSGNLDTLLIEGADAFLGRLDVKENIKTGIVTLAVESSEPKLASEIASTLINELDIHQKKFTRGQVKKKRMFIEERIENVATDLVEIEEKLKTFRIQNRKYIDSPSLLLEFERLMREVEMQNQLYITLKKEFEMAQIEEVEDSDILFVIDEPETPIYYSRPRKKFFVILASLLGLGLGFVISILFNSYKKNIKTVIK